MGKNKPEYTEEQLQALLKKNRLSIDEAQAILGDEHIKSLEVLSFFFYQIGQYDSALRGCKGLLALQPDNQFAQNLQVLCADALEDYNEVVKLTSHLPEKSSPMFKPLVLLKARALQKLSQSSEAQTCLKQLL